MVSLDVKWSEPYQFKTEYGDWWKRDWLIPAQHRSEFFIYWRSNSFKLKDKGYGVLKKNEDWYLTESKPEKHLFKEFSHTAPQEVEKNDFFLTPKVVKDISGLRPWQVAAVGKICAALEKWGCAIDGSDVGIGKCHSKGTKIRLYSGEIKNVEDIKVGDLLMGDDSSPRKVLSLARGEDKMYEIHPTNGGVIWGCNSEHILVLNHTSRKQQIEITVKEFLRRNRSTRHGWTLIRTAVEYPSRSLDVDPYFMGMWIGDGNWNAVAVTISKDDIETIEYVNSLTLDGESRIYKSKDRPNNKSNTYYIRGSECGKNIWLERFRKYGLLKNIEKFIPKEFLINSSLNRKKLLAGLIDSDGWKDQNGCYGFVTKWDSLKDGVIELSRSLGYKVSVKECVTKNNNFGCNGYKFWKIQISGAHDLPVLLPRKKSSPRKQKKSVLYSGFNIKEVGAGEYYGFTLDGNHRYLLEDFTITHNTYTACGVARELNMDILVICPKAVKEAWRRVVKNHFKMAGRLVGITNYEQVRIGKEDSDIASYVRNKKTHVKEFIWKIPKDTLIIWDESQKLKGAKTQNSEVCLHALKQGYKMLFCSATNATNPLELRTVGMSLKLFENNKQYYTWLYRHGCSKGRFGLQFNNSKEVLTKLNRDIFVDRGIRLTRDTIPNFPESQISAECYNMEEESRNKIDTLYAEMKAELNRLNKKEKRGKKDSTSQLTAILRARQKIELVKVPLFVDMIEEGIENGMSVVVFVNFTETLETIAKRLNTKCIVNGKVKDDDRQRNIDDFQSDASRVIIVNIAAGGAGLSLHDLNGKYPRLALISPSYSAVQMRQATGRVWRDSAKSKSIQKIVFVANTVEVEVCEAVNRKLDNLDLLNDGDMEHYGQADKS